MREHQCIRHIDRQIQYLNYLAITLILDMVMSLEYPSFYQANLVGAKDEKLPYLLGNAALLKLDLATEEQKKECSKYPYSRVVGQLMYGMEAP